jgi:hypothetical protein
MDTWSTDDRVPAPRRTPQDADRPRKRRFTRDEYHRMAEAGLFDGERVELINGEVVRIGPQTTTHSMVVQLVTQALRRLETPDRQVARSCPWGSASGQSQNRTLRSWREAPASS